MKYKMECPECKKEIERKSADESFHCVDCNIHFHTLSDICVDADGKRISDGKQIPRYMIHGTEEWNLREKLAELEHEQWAHWTNYLLDNANMENIKRWRKQINIPYSKLSEKEKESDREWAGKVLDIINKHSPTSVGFDLPDDYYESDEYLLEEGD